MSFLPGFLILFTFLLGTGTVCSVAGHPEIGLSLLSMGGIFSFVCWVMAREHLAVAFLLVAFLAGYLLSWCIGFLGYYLVLPGRGFAYEVIGSHFEGTAVLVLLAIVGACAGGGLAIRLAGFLWRRVRVEACPWQTLWPQLVVFGPIFLAYQFISLQVVGLNSRWEMGASLPVGSSAYWLGGLRPALLAFYVLLGLSLRRPIRRNRNYFVGAIVLACMGFNSLTGGREYALEPFVMCAGAALFSAIGWRALAALCALALPVIVAVMLVIGWARGAGLGFEGGSAAEKVAALGQVIREGSSETSVASDPAYLFFSRLFESSAQGVMDDTTESNTRLGWLDFDRLQFLYTPRFLYPDKPALNDGWERLVRFHGYADNDYSSAPLTILADAYERFGAPGVVLFHFAAGVILVFIGRLVLALRWDVLKLVLLVCFGKAALRLYAASVLQFVSITCYSFVRDALIISSIFSLGCLAGHVLRPRSQRGGTLRRRHGPETWIG